MRLSDYDLGRSIICCYSSSAETDEILFCKGLTPFHIKEGMFILPTESISYRYSGSLGNGNDPEEFDVVEVSDSGIVHPLFSASGDDATLFLTPKCNSNCVMCPSSDASRMSDSSEDTEYFLELIKYIPDSLDHITITGGEPFLFGDGIFRIIEEIKRISPGRQLLILTNGRVFSLEGYAERLAAVAPENTVVAIPIHADNAELHDSISRAGGSFDQTMTGISNLLHHRMFVEVRVVVSRLNSDRLNEIAEMIADRVPGVYVVHFIGMEMLGNAAVNSGSLWIPYSDAVKKILPAFDLLVNRGINAELYNFPLCLVPDRYWMSSRKSISDYKRYYGDCCSDCEVASECGGIFIGSRRFAENELMSVHYE